LVELVGESGAESNAAVEVFGAVGIGDAGSTAAARSFGSGSDAAASCSNCYDGNSCGGNYFARDSGADNCCAGNYR
jgi:hypothetical protein